MTTRISPHQTRIYAALKSSDGWITSNDVAAQAEVAKRTANLHLKTLAALGVAEVDQVFPSFLYRVNPKMSKTSAAIASRLAARQAVGK